MSIKFIKIFGVIILLAFIFNENYFGQLYKADNFGQTLINWEGYESKNILDQIFKLNKLSDSEINDYQWNIVIRTYINGFSPIEYQITIRKKNPPRNGEPFDLNKGELSLIFEYPVTQSIANQSREIIKLNPHLTFDEIINKIKIKRDTIIIDKNFRYRELLNEVDTLSIPLIFPGYLILDGTNCQVFIQNISYKNYIVLPFGNEDIPLTSWIKRLFKESIDYFGAIDPYKKPKEKND